MASKIKINGLKYRKLKLIVDRGIVGYPSDRRYFPPAKVFLPLAREGLVYQQRKGSRKSKLTMWFLTPKGEAAMNVAMNHETGKYETNV